MGSNVVLVTGGTSGIGLAIAKSLHEGGATVYAGSRHPEAAGALPFDTVVLDVDSDTSTAEAVATVLEAEGRLDVVINCAGFGIAGPVEETSLDHAKAQFETNYFGTVRMCKAALPSMRTAGRGLIINMSSLGGLVAVPFHAHYCASKFAVEGFTEGLRMEVAPFGISVVLVEPGDYRTGFTGARIVSRGPAGTSAYDPGFQRSLETMERSEATGPSPEPVAALVTRIVHETSPGLRYAVAPFPQSLVPALKRILPWRAMERLVTKSYSGS